MFVCQFDHIHFFNNIFSFTLDSKLLLLLSVTLPCAVSSSLFAARSPGETKIPERDTIISLLSLYRSDFLCLIIFFRFFVMRILLHSNDTNNRKTSAVCSLYKEYQTDNENPMNGRAFAISALFSC